MNWLIRNWFKAPVFLAMYSLLFIFLFIFPENKALFLIWLHVPVYLLHETEEFIFPGGFPEMMTEMMTGKKNEEVPFCIMKAGFWINIPFIVVGFPLVATLATFFGISWGLYVVYFSLIATLPHFGSAIMTKKFYNPGMVVSLFLNLPVSVYTLYYLNSNQLISLIDNVVGCLLALFCMVVPMVYQLLKAVTEYHNMDKIDIKEIKKRISSVH